MLIALFHFLQSVNERHFAHLEHQQVVVHLVLLVTDEHLILFLTVFLQLLNQVTADRTHTHTYQPGRASSYAIFGLDHVIAVLGCHCLSSVDDRDLRSSGSSAAKASLTGLLLECESGGFFNSRITS